MPGRRSVPWTKAFGRDLLTSSRFMGCPIGARGTWCVIAFCLTDDQGLVYAYEDKGRLVPYGYREMAAELRISYATLRGHLDLLVGRGLLELVEDAPGVYRVPRFAEKAGESRQVARARKQFRRLAGQVVRRRKA